MKSYPVTCVSLIVICFLSVILIFISGCSAPIQNYSVRTSGFLNEYSQLREGKDGEALKVYVNQGVNFNLYDKVLLDPVTIIFSDDSNMAKISAGDRQKMADYFYAVLEEHLSDRYVIASRPGSLTMRLRFALTDIKDSKALIKTVSDAHATGSSMDQTSHTSTGTAAYIGDASAEMEILDSMTGQRLAAAVDSRSCVLNNLKEICDYWAQRVAQRLREFAAGH